MEQQDPENRMEGEEQEGRKREDGGGRWCFRRDGGEDRGEKEKEECGLEELTTRRICQRVRHSGETD